jgi:ParB/RepB/Spo0J family partition protein
MEALVAELRQIPVEQIETPQRPARRFLGDIAALAESMQDFGLQQPISVRVDGDRYVLTSGLRRLAAARLLRWQTIPGFVRNVSADDAYVLDLIENLQREDLSAEEEADALGELIRTRGWTLQQVADTIKRSLAYVSKRVRLFEDPLLREAVSKGDMPVSTAEVLLGASPDQRSRLIDQALAERWDQVRARDTLRLLTAATSEAEPLPEPVPDVRTPMPTEEWEAPATRPDAPHPGDAGQRSRPSGFTHAIREFHRVLVEVRAVDLTSADRAALRSLYRDLVLLARAATTPAAPVFPPLPTVTGSATTRRARGVTSTRSRRSNSSRP